MEIPHNIETESSIIGAALVDRCIPYDAKMLSTTDFYLNSHRLIWQVVCELDEESQPLDILEISNRTGQKASELGQMSLGVPIHWNTKKAVEQLKTLSTLRTLQKGFADLSRKAEAREPINDLLDPPEGFIKTIKADREKDEGNARMLIDVYEHDVFPRLDKYVSGELVKVPFGFSALDVSTNGGASAGELVILGAKPKSGKSAMVLQIAKYQAEQNIGVYYCSREMLNYENAQRAMAQSTKYTVNHFRSGLYAASAESLKEYARERGNVPLALDDKSKTVKEMRKEILRLESSGVEITSVFVDYVQLIRSNSRSQNKADILEEIIYDLKDLATDMEKVVYVNAQFNRDGIDAEKPKMSDFKGSSAIEMAGNLVLLWTLKQEVDSISQGRLGEMWIEAGRSVAYDKFNITFYGEKTLFGMA